MSLNNEEKVRYSRHLNLPEFGLATQELLKNAKVLVVGTGGLGAPLLQYLTAAGVGTIGVVDFDTVDVSNLQRQVLFDHNDIGSSKTSVAIRKLKAQNPHVHFIEHNETLTSVNALKIIAGYDVVADGTDNFPTRYLVNDACVLSGKTNVYASIFQFEGQVSVFNYKSGTDYGPNYRDIFPTPPPPGMVPSCAEGGVLGVLPGIIGSIQALEVIKVLTGIGTTLSGRLFIMDTLDFSTRVMNVRKDPDNPLTGEHPTIHSLIDYEQFCGVYTIDPTIQSITVHELKQWQVSNKEFTLVDVRELYEYETSHLNGLLIPESQIDQNIDLIPSNQPIVFHCKSGKRSERVVRHLQKKHQMAQLFNLKGGMLAWREAFDPEMIIV